MRGVALLVGPAQDRRGVHGGDHGRQAVGRDRAEQGEQRRREDLDLGPQPRAAGGGSSGLHRADLGHVAPPPGLAGDRRSVPLRTARENQVWHRRRGRHQDMSYPDDTDPADIDAIETSPDEDDAANTGLVDPGIDRHAFASEWETLWEEARIDPRETLPELADLVRRLMVRHGYAREIVATYAAAREVADRVREGATVDAGDASQAIGDLRDIYESLIERVEGRAR
jgi:hypothetical protein